MIRFSILEILLPKTKAVPIAIPGDAGMPVRTISGLESFISIISR